MNAKDVGFGDQTIRDELSGLLLSCPGAGAWIWNLAKNTVTWSQEVYRIFEAPDFDNRLESFRDMILPDDMEAGLAVISRALTSREPFHTHVRIKTPKGRCRRVMNSGRAVYDKSGKPKMVVGLVADVDHAERRDDRLLDRRSTASRDDPGIVRLGDLHEHFLYVRAQPASAASAETDRKILSFILEKIMDHKAASNLSNTLLEKFDSVAAVLSADRMRLREVNGIDEAHIKLLDVTQYAIENILHPRSEPLKFGHADTLINYLRASHAFQSKEQLRIIFLNRADHLIASEVLQEGTVDHTPVYAREIIKRALELSASTIVLVHNHPSGDPTPSVADLELTSRIGKLALGLGIDVRDHIIMGRYGHISLRRAGLLQ